MKDGSESAVVSGRWKGWLCAEVEASTCKSTSMMPRRAPRHFNSSPTNAAIALPDPLAEPRAGQTRRWERIGRVAFLAYLIKVFLNLNGVVSEILFNLRKLICNSQVGSRLRVKLAILRSSRHDAGASLSLPAARHWTRGRLRH